MDNGFAAYTGSEKCILTSYSPADAGDVCPSFRSIWSEGFRIWFRTPEEERKDIPEEILASGAVMLVYLSMNSAEDEQVKKDIAAAAAHEIPVIGVELGEMKLPEEFENSLDVFQRTDLSAYETYGDFADGLRFTLEKFEVGSGERRRYEDEVIRITQEEHKKKNTNIALIAVGAVVAFCGLFYLLLFNPVPDVVGMDVIPARRAMDDAGFYVEIDKQYNDEFEYGLVYDQDAHGRSFKLIPVTIRESLGKEENLVEFPSIMGDTPTEACRKLREMGLTEFEFFPEESETRDLGQVVSQNIHPRLRVSYHTKMRMGVVTDGEDLTVEIDGVTYIIDGKRDTYINVEEP